MFKTSTLIHDGRKEQECSAVAPILSDVEYSGILSPRNSNSPPLAVALHLA